MRRRDALYRFVAVSVGLLLMMGSMCACGSSEDESAKTEKVTPASSDDLDKSKTIISKGNGALWLEIAEPYMADTGEPAQSIFDFQSGHVDVTCVYAFNKNTLLCCSGSGAIGPKVGDDGYLDGEKFFSISLESLANMSDEEIVEMFKSRDEEITNAQIQWMKDQTEEAIMNVADSQRQSTLESIRSDIERIEANNIPHPYLLIVETDNQGDIETIKLHCVYGEFPYFTDTNGELAYGVDEAASIYCDLLPGDRIIYRKSSSEPISGMVGSDYYIGYRNSEEHVCWITKSMPGVEPTPEAFFLKGAIFNPSEADIEAFDEANGYEQL